MARGLVYPLGEVSPARTKHGRARGVKEPSAEEDSGREPGTAPREAEKPADGYREKLVKYVPAEVVAGFIPLTAFIGTGEDALLVLALAAGAIATLGYLRKENLKVPSGQRAPFWAYALALWAFLAWALATSPPTAEVFGLSLKAAGVILAISAFVIPALDFWGVERE